MIQIILKKTIYLLLGSFSCLIISGVFLGCSDDKEELRRQRDAEYDREDRDFFKDSNNPEEQRKSIETPCDSKIEGGVILKGKNEYVCSNGEWILKEN